MFVSLQPLQQPVLHSPEATIRRFSGAWNDRQLLTRSRREIRLACTIRQYRTVSGRLCYLAQCLRDIAQVSTFVGTSQAAEALVGLKKKRVIPRSESLLEGDDLAQRNRTCSRKR